MIKKKLLQPESSMKKMSFNMRLFLMPLLLIGFTSCQNLEPEDPKQSIPGLQLYYNEQLNFSLSYPRILNIKVEDRSVAGAPDVLLNLSYPGNDYPILELSTHAISWIESLKDTMIPGTEGTIKVGGIRAIKFDIAMDDERGIFSKERIIVRNQGKLYAFTGNGETFDEIVDSFRFLSEEESQTEE